MHMVDVSVGIIINDFFQWQQNYHLIYLLFVLGLFSGLYASDLWVFERPKSIYLQQK